ncbi:hypothetical protein QL285_074817 [Trifolium repens]|nr:hypothetical protein QL285_074817 [Trifolium repens]
MIQINCLLCMFSFTAIKILWKLFNSFLCQCQPDIARGLHRFIKELQIDFNIFIIFILINGFVVVHILIFFIIEPETIIKIKWFG